jgi:hypothetical protein
MNYQCVGSGGVSVGGCAPTEKFIFLYFKYGEGSIVFNAAKAAKGVLEAIAIKHVRLVNNKRTYGKTLPLYQDTLNGLWNENELIPEDEARTIAGMYLAQQMALLKQGQLTCPTSS